MKGSYEEQINDIYNRRISNYGVSPRSLGWTKGRAVLRFRILTSQWDFNNSSVLDFGCGYGDLYKFLIQNFKNVQYTGVDINPHFINEALNSFSSVDFRLLNILEAGIDEKWDYVIVSGSFNDKLDDNYKIIRKAFEKFNLIASKGFASNFISDKVDYFDSHVFYANPSKILSLAYKFSNKIVLRNDYMPYEFTAFVDKTENIHPTLTIYEEFEGLMN